MLRIENGEYKIDSSCTKIHKRIKRHYSQWVKTFKRAFHHVYRGAKDQYFKLKKPVFVDCRGIADFSKNLRFTKTTIFILNY